MGHRDDFIAWTDAQRTECEIKSVRAIADADTRLASQYAANSFSKRRTSSPPTNALLVMMSLNRGVDLGLNRLILVEETDEWNILGIY